MWRHLQPYLTWRRAQLWLGLVAAVGLTLCFVPLFDLLGYEFSLVIAVVASLAAGDLAATYPERVRQQQAPFPGARLTIARLSLTTTSLGFSLLVLPLLFISINALRVRNCDYLEGLAFFLLGPVAAVAVASAWGLVIGVTAGGRRRATTLWVLVWLGAIAVELHEGWATPAVRSFGSLHGYFSGVLYDEAVTIPVELVTFRLRDAVEVLALLGLCHWLIDRSELRLRLRGAWGERRRALLPLGAALGAALGVAFAPALGHRRDAEDVAEALGGRARFGRCVVIHADSIDAEAAARVARDCAFRLHQHEQFFDIEFPGELTVYLFADPEQKQELIGAGRTSVAKPWRREVYIQGAQFPHPVLSHEIAHVITAVFGAQPLGVSGRLGGVLVSPGLVEGAAVAAAWDEEELTPHLWSKAMIELGVAPPLESVLGLDFLTLNASRAYVLAGSFSRYLIETHGPARYRQAYRTADPAAAYGRPVVELERQWRRFLEDVELRPGDLELARDRFDRPAVFGKVCAHEVAQLRQRARRCEARENWDQAAQLRRKVVRYSARDASSQYQLARDLARR